MTTDIEKQVPLYELLEKVPATARMLIETEFASTSHPIGRMAHEAAAELRRLHAENERLRVDAERYRYIRWALSNAKFDYYNAEDSSEPEIDAQVDEERAALAKETK